MDFYKIHALGNDFIIFGNPFEKRPPNSKLIQYISDRHFGVGCDCVVYIGQSDTADFFMHVYNPNGFEAEICGNALRCSAKYIYEKGYFTKRDFLIETNSGTKKVSVSDDLITAEIGKAEIQEVNCINVAGVNIPYVSVSFGNPHCVVFVNKMTDDEFELFGKAIEAHPVFSNGTNVEFAHIIDENNIEMRVWERGIGETLSCTTGSCACFAAAKHLGSEIKSCNVIQRGGALNVFVDENENYKVIGPCTVVFKGTLLNLGRNI